jgi:short-subunit dehydrogenase
MTAICPGATDSEFATTAGFKNTKAFDSAPSSTDLAKFIYDSQQKKKISAIQGFKNNALMICLLVIDSLCELCVYGTPRSVRSNIIKNPVI